MSSQDVATAAAIDENLVLLNHDNHDTWARRMQYQLERENVWWAITRMPEEPETLDTLASFVVGSNNPTIAKYKLKWELDSKKAISGIMANCDTIQYEEVNRHGGRRALSISYLDQAEDEIKGGGWCVKCRTLG